MPFIYRLLVAVMLFTIAVQPLHAQKTPDHTLKGVIYSTIDSLPIPYAYIGIPQLGIGTSTNINGQFELHYDSPIQDTLSITHLSYEKKKLILPATPANDTILFLTPIAFELPDITVLSDDSIAKIAQKIKRNFRKNYPTSLHYSSLFYREIIYDAESNTASRLIESTVGIEDKGYGTPNDNIKAEIIAIRKSDDIDKDNTSVWVSILQKAFPETQNDFFKLLNSNPLRRYRFSDKRKGTNNANDFWGKNLIDMALNRGDLKITGSHHTDSDTFIHLTFEQPGIFTHKGTFTVNTTDFAIVDWTHQVILKNGKVLRDFTYKYYKNNKKYYPYFYRGLTAEYNDDLVTFNHVQTLVFTEHFEKRRNIERIKRSTMISNKGDFYKNTSEYDASYWANQNILLQEPLGEEDIESLSKVTQIETQFKRNGNEPRN